MNISNFPLVTAIEGEARTSTHVLAAGLGQAHKHLIELTRKHLKDLEKMGRVPFEKRPFKTAGGMQRQDVAMLNEHQAALLIAFMRNTPKVVQFKVALIREFFSMRDALRHQRDNLWQQMHALIAQEVESKVRASFGSHLMLKRKHEIPLLESERRRLEDEIQPRLIN